MVTIPYVNRLSEAFSRILKTYRICTAVRPHTTMRNMLVHPKDTTYLSLQLVAAAVCINQLHCTLFPVLELWKKKQKRCLCEHKSA